MKKVLHKLLPNVRQQALAGQDSAAKLGLQICPLKIASQLFSHLVQAKAGF
jgi:hypothetical protein